MTKKRLDTLLVDRGLTETRAKAQALVLAGDVLVAGQTASKAGAMVPEEADISLLAKPPYVGRGGIKLAAALETFGIDVTGKVAIDVGASTGGFTDCLLQHGASKVYAIDVGYGQLDYRLRTDARVAAIDRTNARHPFTLTEKADLATMDLSFISVEKVIPNVAGHLKEDGLLIILLKPQFEAGREEVQRGGVVKDPQVHAKVLGRFIAWLVDNGFRLGGLIPSPILGASGNREFLVLLRMNARYSPSA